MKCPYCGSEKTQTTNLGKRALAFGAAAITYFALFPFARSGAQGPARSASRNVCPNREYICLECKKEFIEGPDL